MNLNKERMIEYTNIPETIKVCMKVVGYPHYQFTGTRVETRNSSILKTQHHQLYCVFPQSTVSVINSFSRIGHFGETMPQTPLHLAYNKHSSPLPLYKMH